MAVLADRAVRVALAEVVLMVLAAAALAAPVALAARPPMANN